ncbi:SOS response-associated peptidase [Shewanella sedimentimangrovi]|uniref:Abasic site processing protein n=1 Tax=Shewanella sedimentimangrovi TaxID=2814293 RepID=A0ABX7QXS4_9GAMM|nr:SOS response-associated peptidase family protein [Shewanella sedimentimangrovi]QSX36249.1 SOS response-associated peptidase family protein [Shewanella sedimentimangrovi]
MCGRLNVIADPLCQLVSEQLGLDFVTEDKKDLRPTDPVTAIGVEQGQLRSWLCRWGIHPQWSKRPLINARVETVNQRSTFADAFANRRMLVPVTGWFEWQQRPGGKQKWLLREAEGRPLYMAAIGFEHEGERRLVTLTTSPTSQCQAIHSRMPLLIPPNECEFFLRGHPDALLPLLQAPVTVELALEPVIDRISESPNLSLF